MTMQKINVIDIIKEANENSDYIGYITDYGDSNYICDVYSYIADNETSIYYSDIIKFISNNVEAVNDAIEEFGWDGCGADLYKAGQMAEYLAIKRELNEYHADAVRLYAADYIRMNYGEEISAEKWDAIETELEDIDTDNRIWDVIEIITDVMDADSDEED